MDLLAFIVSTCFVVYRIKTLPPLMSSNNLETSLRQSLQDGTSRDAQERVCTVTKDNVPTPEGNLRSEMRLKNLWHRATYILVRHSGEDNDEGWEPWPAETFEEPSPKSTENVAV